MSAHTPGPWEVDYDKLGYLYVYETKTLKNADIVEIGRNSEFAEGDARLIAAAPELLEALKAIRDSGPDGGQDFFNWHESYRPAIEKARAAIAKAEGEQ